MSSVRRSRHGCSQLDYDGLGLRVTTGLQGAAPENGQFAHLHAAFPVVNEETTVSFNYKTAK
jgi:hypothetical protein